MKLFDFRGGVHPPSHKHLSAESPIQVLPLPERLYLPLQQHRGQSALPIVTVGQKVLKGELLAKAQGSVSAPVHAPTSGTVVAVGDFTAPHPSGLPLPTIILEPDGEDRPMEMDPLPDPFTLQPDEVARQIGDAGIVGMGGANFPAAVKLSGARKAHVHTLVINGAECEPYMTCDDRLMRERPAEIVDGARIMLHALQAQRALIAIEDNKPEAAACLRKVCEETRDQPLSVEVVVIPSRYPAGSASQLIQLLTGLEVPAEGRSTVTGLLVHNVGTAYAVHRALRDGRPLISRIVTITGGAVAEPKNLEAPIGTLASDMLRFCGADPVAIARLLVGGPMMGQSMPNAQVPLVKGANGLLALTAAEIAGLPETTSCIRCGRCADVCPMGLLPLEMAKRARHDDPDSAMALGLDDCMSCGSCAYACPSHIPLVQYFDYARGLLIAREQADQRADTARRLIAARQARLERQERAKQEAAARRRAEKQQKAGAEVSA